MDIYLTLSNREEEMVYSSHSCLILSRIALILIFVLDHSLENRIVFYRCISKGNTHNVIPTFRLERQFALTLIKHISHATVKHITCILYALKIRPNRPTITIFINQLRTIVYYTQYFFRFIKVTNQRQCLRLHQHDIADTINNPVHLRFRKISPAVIVAVTDGDKLLLTRYADRPYRGPSLIAGFVEIGETLEDTVRREVLEEVGLHVKNIRYYKNQPWSFTDTMLVGFYCELDGEAEIHLDRNELCEGVWMARSELSERENDVSLTAEMIEMFRLGLK